MPVLTLVHVLALATPGGIEDLFAEQYEYLTSLDGPPDLAVLDEMGQRHGSPTVVATNSGSQCAKCDLLLTQRCRPVPFDSIRAEL